MPTYIDAKGADGLKLAAWIDDNLPKFNKDSGEARRLSDWRRGGIAGFYTVDRVMTKYGVHVSDLPDDLWLDHDKSAKGEGVPIGPPRAQGKYPPKVCAAEGCERLVPTRDERGKPLGPKRYEQRKTCGAQCGHVLRTTFRNANREWIPESAWTPKASLEPKVCERCGTMFEREREPAGKLRSPREWAARRFCGQKCSNPANSGWVAKTIVGKRAA